VEEEGSDATPSDQGEGEVDQEEGGGNDPFSVPQTTTSTIREKLPENSATPIAPTTANVTVSQANDVMEEEEGTMAAVIDMSLTAM
jgi:hypothetical protein